jgi:hypothetical protein
MRGKFLPDNEQEVLILAKSDEFPGHAKTVFKISILSSY